MKNTMRKSILLFAFATFIAGCGGGGTPAASTPAPAKKVVTTGVISRFGSVVVNGIEFQTTGTQIKVNGVNAAQGQKDLKVGEMVTIVGDHGQNGKNGQGMATMINFDAEIEGPIASIDTVKNSFVALGQTVVVDTATVFDGTKDLSTLKVGDFVEVSGPRDASNAIRATEIELTNNTATSPVQVQGTVKSLDTAAKTFLLGTQSVDYSAATFDPANLILANDLTVEAKGALVGGVLKANKVALEESMHGDNGQDQGVEGLITKIDSPTQFIVEGIVVVTSPATQYEHGVATDIALNKRVEVEGVIDGTGKLQATNVQFAEKPFIELIGDVQSVDGAAKSLNVLGVTVLTSEKTSFKKDEDQKGSFTLADVRTGDHVKIGASVIDGKLVASIVERQTASTESVVQADVTSADRATHSVNLHGVKVDTTNAAFKGKDEKTTSESAFFDNVKIGDVVKVVGTYDTTLTLIKASRVNLEDQSSHD